MLSWNVFSREYYLKAFTHKVCSLWIKSDEEHKKRLVEEFSFILIFAKSNINKKKRGANFVAYWSVRGRFIYHKNFINLVNIKISLITNRQNLNYFRNILLVYPKWILFQPFILWLKIYAHVCVRVCVSAIGNSYVYMAEYIFVHCECSIVCSL